MNGWTIGQNLSIDHASNNVRMVTAIIQLSLNIYQQIEISVSSGRGENFTVIAHVSNAAKCHPMAE